MKQPKVIFLDAVGTLFGVKGSVGKAYAEIAGQFGVEVSDEALNTAFIKSFVAAPPPIFPGVQIDDIPNYEFEWWQGVALETFQQVGAVNQFKDFSKFFEQLYDHFSTAKPWLLYEDVIPTLERWQKRKIELGIISNFDSRLYLVLESLHLIDFFTSITISTEVSTAKPSQKIFTDSLDKHDCQAKDAWHIGDSFQEDYQGASAAGLKAILIKRN
ncbi:HAD-IA family hydrolase [Synechocystis sp. PCC 7509]|uniref:HAD-IA family hydrolase n=1 Tax=Synechocystis sp. PCC 7509 TaxID=927677 RepID=UPI0002AC173F|nr:HAD-IA family hydrolase [Synechocystis sp. PCC 7509]